LPKQISKQVLRATEASPEALAEANLEPPDPGPRTPAFDAKASPDPRADTREPEAATRSQDGAGVTMSVADVASDVDGTACGAVQPVGKLAEHLMDGRARKAGRGQPAP